MKLTGAEIIVRTFLEHGVGDVFGYPGAAVLDIYDALYKHRKKINHILTAHEQGAAHAADGYYRATGRTGVCLATSGPGATNLVTGIAAAMLDSSALVAVTGNVATGLIGRDSFQEIDIVGVTIPITKHNYFVSDVRELADTMRQAFLTAGSGRPGPVLVDVPVDVQKAVCDYRPQPPLEEKDVLLASGSDIEKAVSLLKGSERPYVYVGGGVVSAGISEKISALAEKLDACVGCTLMGLSAVDSESERFLGMRGKHGSGASNTAMLESDLVLAVGVRFSDRAVENKSVMPKAKLIHLDVDPAEINKNIETDAGIAGDLADTLERISSRVGKAEHPKWMKRCSELKKEYPRWRGYASSGDGPAPAGAVLL